MKLSNTLIPWLALAPLCALAATVDDEFAGGLLGVGWSATLADVMAQFPKGKEQSAGPAALYLAHDGRTVLDVPRRARDLISFEFGGAQLRSIVVGFATQDCPLLVATLTARFGEPTKIPESAAWAWRGEHVEVDAVAAGIGGCLLGLRPTPR